MFGPPIGEVCVTEQDYSVRFNRAGSLQRSRPPAYWGAPDVLNAPGPLVLLTRRRPPLPSAEPFSDQRNAPMRVRVAQASLFLAAQPDPKLTSSVPATRAQACLRSLVICVAGLAIFYAHR
jgi:hypothetical protein